MKNAYLRMMNFKNWPIIIALAVVLIACIDKTEAPEPTPVGFVNLYNAAADGTSLDIYLNDIQSKVNSAPFDYSKYSGYLSFPTGNSTLKFNKYNTDTKVLEDTIRVNEDKAHSFFVINEGAKLSTLFIEDVSEFATATTARLRFIHLSPNPDLIVDLYAKATDFPDSLLFEQKPYK
jgi:hypothetical protein